MASADPLELHMHRVIEKPYDEMEARLQSGPEIWLPGFERKGNQMTGELAYEQGGNRIKRRTEVRVGPVQRFAYGVTVQIGWKGARHPELYPELDGHLRLERRQPSGSSLRFDARYKPPGGRIGATVDRALMHHVAESSVQGFLAQVAELLSAT